MKIYSFIKCLLFGAIFMYTSAAFGQSADTTRAPINPSDIVEAGEAIIKIEVEKPQVQLFSQRIKPEFDEVNLEKSFVKEIIDAGQTIKVETKNDKKRIDIKKLLNRNR